MLHEAVGTYQGITCRRCLRHAAQTHLDSALMLAPCSIWTPSVSVHAVGTPHRSFAGVMQIVSFPTGALVPNCRILSFSDLRFSLCWSLTMQDAKPAGISSGPAVPKSVFASAGDVPETASRQGAAEPTRGRSPAADVSVLDTAASHRSWQGSGVSSRSACCSRHGH